MKENFLVKTHNEKDFHNVLKTLFKKGYTWRDHSKDLVSFDDEYPFILVQDRIVYITCLDIEEHSVGGYPCKLLSLQEILNIGLDIE